MHKPRIVAIIDLGSNSFQLLVARVTPRDHFVLHRNRVSLHLGMGLRNGFIDEAAQARALLCLVTFAKQLENLQVQALRVVGTDVFRKATEAGPFVEKIQKILGAPLEILDGEQEARLVYLGATHARPHLTRPHLVLDIGGGSTELIKGRNNKPEVLTSLSLGCLAVTDSFFPNGRVTATGFRHARRHISAVLAPHRGHFIMERPDPVIGVSGTIKATARILAAMGQPEGILGDGLKMLETMLLKTGDMARHALPTLTDDRARVFPGGLAILSVLFHELAIEKMSISTHGLREGLLVTESRVP